MTYNVIPLWWGDVETGSDRKRYPKLKKSRTILFSGFKKQMLNSWTKIQEQWCLHYTSSENKPSLLRFLSMSLESLQQTESFPHSFEAKANPLPSQNLKNKNKNMLLTEKYTAVCSNLLIPLSHELLNELKFYFMMHMPPQGFFFFFLLSCSLINNFG